MTVLFFQGRFMAAVAVILLLGLSLATFALSCTAQGAITSIIGHMAGFPDITECVALIPSGLGTLLGVVFIFLASAALLQGVLG